MTLPTLPSLQAGFLAAQHDPGLATELFGQTAPQVGVYANNARVTVLNAVIDAYPTMVALLGLETVRAMAADFVAAHPPQDWDLNRFGGGLSSYLQVQDSDFTLLADVAKLDWAIHDAAFAPETPPLQAAVLLALNEEVLALLRWTLRATSTWVVSAEPIGAIRKAAMVAPFVRPDGSAETVLVGRDGNRRVWFRTLEAGEAALVAALLQGQTLAEAAGAALNADAEFDLGAALGQQFADQVWLSSPVETPDPRP